WSAEVCSSDLPPRVDSGGSAAWPRESASRPVGRAPGLAHEILVGGGEHRLAEVRVGENETFESALRRFNKKIQQSGILAEARRREHYEKPSVKRKRKEDKRNKNAQTRAGGPRARRARPRAFRGRRPLIRRRPAPARGSHSGVPSRSD